MKMKFLLVLFISLVASTTVLKAQNCDPWIIKAYSQLYGRRPSSEECNIKNYHNGSWNSYAELVGYIAGYNRNKPGNFLKGDPWIFQIYTELYNRVPTAWELNINNYNGGSWNNYAELKNYIQAYQNSLRKQGMDIKTAPYNGNVLVGFFINGQQVAANVVAAGGGNVIAAGGGNVIAAGGGNVIAAGGGNVIAAGGGNIVVNNNMAGVRFGGSYTVSAVGTKVIPTSGKGALIIQK